MNTATTYVVTGGTGGIGLHTATELARTGARVIITGRNPERGHAARKEIQSATGNPDIHLELVDLASRSQTEALGKRIVEKHQRVDVLLNNAGLLAWELGTSIDGLELDFAVNVAAPWWLTLSVQPALQRAPHPRVVNVTGGTPVGGVDADNLQAEKGFVGLTTYSASKRAMEAMSQELRRRLQPDGVEVVVVSGAGLLPWWMRPMWPMFALFSREDGGKSAKKASRSSVWAATTKDLGVSDERFVNPTLTTKPLHKTVMNPEVQRRVIETIESASA